MDCDHVQTILDRANELLEAGQPAESLAHLARLEDGLVTAEDRIEYASLKAWALSELGHTDDALDVLEALIDEYPASAQLHGTRGVVLSNDGDLDEACDALEQAITLDATDEAALANLGLIYERLRQYERALQLYDRAAEAGAEIDWILQRTAAVQVELGDVAAARVSLKRYLSLAPDDVEHWITLAILHSDEGEFEQAFHCYRAAEHIVPDSATLRLNWGVTAVRAHALEVARQQLKYLARLEPGASRPLLLEAFISEEQGELNVARRKYVDALRRLRRDDYAELIYGLEMTMDFFARHGRRGPCERLLEQAYRANACTVELCEAYRAVTGAAVEQASWHSLIVEGDYRPGLEEVPDPGDVVNRPPTRFLRNFQVIARDHDEAVALAMEFASRMGESNVLVRAFVTEEPIEGARVGVYEVERESVTFAGGATE